MTDFDVATRPNAGASATVSPTATTPSADQSLTEQAKAQAGPLVDKARGFAKARPWTAAALAGVVGLAVLNTLRGRR